jgi:hypothetical protein
VSAASSGPTLAERARALGLLPPGWYRVLILEANQSLTHWDSPSFQLARALRRPGGGRGGRASPRSRDLRRLPPGGVPRGDAVVTQVVVPARGAT